PATPVIITLSLHDPLPISMGVTYIEGKVAGLGGEVAVRFLVDSGASYSLLAEADWKAIGLEPKRAATFTLADGTRLERQISECQDRKSTRLNSSHRTISYA